MTTVSSEPYRGSCHCGAVRFEFRSEPITAGFRCNCSICVRKGTVVSKYIAAADFELVAGDESLTTYQFGDQDVAHCFCKTCGVTPFSVVVRLPDGYHGAATRGARRVNLGCVAELDALALDIATLNGRAL